MMLLLILLVFSVVLNVVFIFGIVRRQDEENVTFIKLSEKLRVD
jgi:preprotein translocase subunit YajC